jgi:hypothetical protein
VLVLEILLGAALSAALLLTLNTALMVYALSILLGPVLLKARWENGVLAAVLPLPYLLLIGSMGALGANLWGMQGIFYMFFPFHL